jgi:hypothetical protein
VPFPPRTRIAPLLSRRKIVVLAIETLLLCGVLPVARWLGAPAAWLVAPSCVLWLAAIVFVFTAPALLDATVRRAACRLLLFCAGSVAIGAASLALDSVAYDGHLRATVSRLDRVVTAVESHRRTSGSLPRSLDDLATNTDCGLAPDEWRRLRYELQPESQPATFGLSLDVPDQGLPFLFSFGTYLVYCSQWDERRIKGRWRDLGRGWKVIEAD